ncbi:hypothetical protein BJ684DRAFT_19277 [Piptocephalis cylindrospora]|uniref:Uncharacterized protein n=1 Tax=Piptocephalis cylindrospora TaxID=1907219 RepID=A0A4V1IYE7_9FUNG|nr:hypothetical protein BJ684DRAFT_19277 [Piptocephalis cylindrospora]|eukprot:RKP14299.1 hypothetical protein BJ684DRAFT_19277 [Piptocephalis cylindrospora]
MVQLKSSYHLGCFTKAITTAFQVTVEAYSGEFALDRPNTTNLRSQPPPSHHQIPAPTFGPANHPKRSGLSRSLNSLRRLHRRMSGRRSKPASVDRGQVQEGLVENITSAPSRINEAPQRVPPPPLFPVMERADSWASGATLVITASRAHAA